MRSLTRNVTATAAIWVVAMACLLQCLGVQGLVVNPWINESFTAESNIECGSPDFYTAPVLPASVYSVAGAEIEASEEVDTELADIARMSDFALDAQDIHRAECVVSWVRQWGDQDAFMCNSSVAVDENGNDPSGTRYWRSLMTAGVAAAFLKTQGGHTTAAATADVAGAHAWLATMMSCNKNWTNGPLKEWAGAAGTVDEPHFAAYPALLAVLLTASATGDEASFVWAATQLDAALSTVTAAGFAAGTVASNADALSQQSVGVLNYAIPAAMLIHANAQAGVAVPDIATNTGLARMAWRTAHGLRNATAFVKTFGVVQRQEDCGQGDTWPWLYAMLLEESGPSSTVVAVSKTAAANLSIAYDVAELKDLVTRCDPEDTFDVTTGGRTCWWHPATFYSSPCVGWTNGPIIAFVIAVTTVAALGLFCICFLCNKDTCCYCMVARKNKGKNNGSGNKPSPQEKVPLRRRSSSASDASDTPGQHGHAETKPVMP